MLQTQIQEQGKEKYLTMLLEERGADEDYWRDVERITDGEQEISDEIHEFLGHKKRNTEKR